MNLRQSYCKENFSKESIGSLLRLAQTLEAYSILVAIACVTHDMQVTIRVVFEGTRLSTIIIICQSIYNIQSLSKKCINCYKDIETNNSQSIESRFLKMILSFVSCIGNIKVIQIRNQIIFNTIDIMFVTNSLLIK